MHVNIISVRGVHSNTLHKNPLTIRLKVMDKCVCERHSQWRNRLVKKEHTASKYTSGRPEECPGSRQWKLKAPKGTTDHTVIYFQYQIDTLLPASIHPPPHASTPLCFSDTGAEANSSQRQPVWSLSRQELLRWLDYLTP